MYPRVVSVKALEDFKLYVQFHDGASGVVDVSDLIGKGVFAHLANREAFEAVYVSAETETVTWEGELDLDPVRLYADALNVDPASVWSMPEPSVHA
jgi:hypothetical protein